MNDMTQGFVDPNFFSRLQKQYEDMRTQLDNKPVATQQVKPIDFTNFSLFNHSPQAPAKQEEAPVTAPEAPSTTVLEGNGRDPQSAEHPSSLTNQQLATELQNNISASSFLSPLQTPVGKIGLGVLGTVTGSPIGTTLGLMAKANELGYSTLMREAVQREDFGPYGRGIGFMSVPEDIAPQTISQLHSALDALTTDRGWDTSATDGAVGGVGHNDHSYGGISRSDTPGGMGKGNPEMGADRDRGGGGRDSASSGPGEGGGMGGVGPGGRGDPNGW